MLLEVELFKLRCYVFKYKLQLKTKERLLYRDTLHKYPYFCLSTECEYFFLSLLHLGNQ